MKHRLAFASASLSLIVIATLSAYAAVSHVKARPRPAPHQHAEVKMPANPYTKPQRFSVGANGDVTFYYSNLMPITVNARYQPEPSNPAYQEIPRMTQLLLWKRARMIYFSDANNVVSDLKRSVNQ